jgi:hypothetical protein
MVERMRIHSVSSRRSRGPASRTRCLTRSSAIGINPGSLLILAAIARANLREPASCSSCETSFDVLAAGRDRSNSATGGTPPSRICVRHPRADHLDSPLVATMYSLSVSVLSRVSPAGIQLFRSVLRSMGSRVANLRHYIGLQIVISESCQTARREFSRDDRVSTFSG